MLYQPFSWAILSANTSVFISYWTQKQIHQSKIKRKLSFLYNYTIRIKYDISFQTYKIL
jgi:hypothetical protein